MHYAHQHLVVHRDIKPSNILVTTYGEPKLLDFGIAKLLDAVTNVAPERTLTLHNVLTPEYASPEHVRGDPITTASDVYSLGVLLYELLTETKPYKIDNRTPIEIARVITEKEPTKPSTAIRASRFENQHSANSRVTIHDSRRLKGDLDNIVLKAMRKEPLRRYSSVAEFAADIRRHLDGLPVRARKDTFAYRSSKFVSRHRVGVAAAALIFLSLAGGIVFSAHEARRAQQRFNDVRQLAHSLMFEIHDSVQDLQGSTPTRKLIVARALEYLDRLNADGGSDPSLQGELATAYEKIGDIQGNPYAANLGDADGALASYRKAMSIRERLNKRASSVQSQIALALSYRGVGDVLELKGDLDERLKNYRRSLEILQRVAATNRDVFQAQDELARGWETLGDGLSRTNDKAETARAYNQTLQIRAQLLGNDPTNPKKKRSMAMALMKTASVPGVQKEEAVAKMRRAISTFEEIAAADPQNARARREVGFAYYELGMILAATNDHAEALPVRQRALQIREEFAAQDPKNQQARFDLAVGYGDVAESLANLHAADEAITHADKAVAIMTELNASDSKNAIYARNLALAYERLAQAFETAAHNENASTTKRTQNFSSAREYYAKARDLFAGLRDRGALLPMDRDQIDKFNSRIAGADQQLAQLRR